MKNQNVRRTNIKLDFHLHSIYGNKAYKEIKDWHNVSTLKKYLTKILNTYRVAIESTITHTDNWHKTQIFSLIDKEKESLLSFQTFDEIDQSMITFQSELIFLLIGSMPDNWQSRNVTNHRRNWKLDGNRKIFYQQDNNQKMNLIFTVVSKGIYNDQLPDLDTLRRIYWRDCKKDPNTFIQWFKDKYPKPYIELF